MSAIPLGDLLRMNQQNAILHTYFRNNILHLFAMPSLLACCFLNNPSLRTEDLMRLAWRIYPYIAAELFLPWREDQVPDDRAVPFSINSRSCNSSSATRTAPKWRRRSPLVVEAMQLSVLAQGAIQIVQRYYMAIALLIQAGSGPDQPGSAGQALPPDGTAHLHAVRAELAGISSSKTLFSNFIDLLRGGGTCKRARTTAVAVQRGAAQRRQRCTARAERADPPQHSAGDARIGAVRAGHGWGKVPTPG